MLAPVKRLANASFWQICWLGCLTKDPLPFKINNNEYHICFYLSFRHGYICHFLCRKYQTLTGKKALISNWFYFSCCGDDFFKDGRLFPANDSYFLHKHLFYLKSISGLKKRSTLKTFNCLGNTIQQFKKKKFNLFRRLTFYITSLLLWVYYKRGFSGKST